MRGLIEGLESPHPLGETLPAMYQEHDEFALRFTQALDEVIAPVMLALDNLDAYFDPHVAPRDFLTWLAAWVGIELDETWPEEKQREQVKNAVELYRWRGTRKGLADVIELYIGVRPEVVDNGATTASSTPNEPLPGSPDLMLTVTLRVGPNVDVDEGRVNDLIMEAKPAHVPHQLVLVRVDEPSGSAKRAATPKLEVPPASEEPETQAESEPEGEGES
jgi:phage tail-like protein